MGNPLPFSITSLWGKLNTFGKICLATNYLIVDGGVNSPATATLSKGEWLILSHSVAKRLVFANSLAKTTSFAEILRISEAARRFNPKD